MPLPEAYAWLAKEPGPKMILEALKLYGVHEGLGAADNPQILAWAAEVGLKSTYTHDEEPWCGLLCAVVAKRAGKNIPAQPLWARNWLNFGAPVTVAMLGDVLVFSRPGGGGHVGLYVAESGPNLCVLAGNQDDQVNIARIPRTRLLGIRRPIYVEQPTNVRQIFVNDAGAISENEA